jgi:hypothetical protein
MAIVRKFVEGAILGAKEKGTAEAVPQRIRVDPRESVAMKSAGCEFASRRADECVRPYTSIANPGTRRTRAADPLEDNVVERED